MCECLVVFKCLKTPHGIVEFIHRKLTLEDHGNFSLKETLVEKNMLIVNLANIPALLVLQVFEFVIDVQFKSCIDVPPKGTEQSPRPFLCRCSDLFNVLEGVIRSGKFDVYSLRKCHDKGFISEESGTRSIETEFIDQAVNLVRELCSCKDAVSQIIRESTVAEEKELSATEIGAGIGSTDYAWVEQVSQVRAKYRMTQEKFRILEDKLGIKRSSSIIESGNKTSNPSTNIEPSLQEHAGALVPSYSTSENAEADVKSPVLITYSLPRLLQVFVDRLLSEDWKRIRQAIADQIPAQVLSSLPNGIGIFNELVNRNIVTSGDLSFLRKLFYETQRVDLVHLADCIEEGDYSLLTDEHGVLQQSRRYDVPFVNDGLTGVPVQEMQHLAVERRQQAVGSPPGAVDETNAHDGTDEAPVEADGEVSTPWNESPEVSCEHYDRYCDVKFNCCERFWPCHRCHNADSLCGRKTLRSRDIKKIKCKKCGKIQEFPKQRPNCVHCNLKFADYFCAICQHLTGTQNHPYHCSKCGICRVHGDRSFHCDVCGVCLDMNLEGNHLCRANSAHDECCICFEDAFTGCQILPCSHKVHKDCATMMLQNGITRCPICRESFAHRIERRPING